MTFAPSCYSTEILANAIALSFDASNSKRVSDATIETSASFILDYVRWHGGKDYIGAHTFNRITLQDWLRQLGDSCSQSWDGNNYAWDYYVDLLRKRIDEATFYSVKWV